MVPGIHRGFPAAVQEQACTPNERQKFVSHTLYMIKSSVLHYWFIDFFSFFYHN
jgi:hypothetical protein